jgi:hypothetical protein
MVRYEGLGAYEGKKKGDKEKNDGEGKSASRK